jgi:hypothetical protein
MPSRDFAQIKYLSEKIFARAQSLRGDRAVPISEKLVASTFQTLNALAIGAGVAAATWR